MRRRLPYRPFRHEWIVLVGIAFATLAIVHPRNPQDHSRLALTQALIQHGRVSIDGYGVPLDRARYDGRLYTDKAPGLSLAAIPVMAATRIAERVSGSGGVHPWDAPRKLWLVRVVVLAPFLMALALLVGRVAEGLVEGAGPLTAVAVSLGTMLGALSSVLFAHVPAAALAFGGFVVLARGRSAVSALAGGALAGAAVLVEYEAGLIALALAVYVLVARGRLATMWYLVGGAPSAIALGVYNWVAFGSPFRLSYRFKDGVLDEFHEEGFFGVASPDWSSLSATLVGERGLVMLAPALVLAAIGLIPFARRFRAEAVLSAAIVLLFVALEAGYFDPYGGVSPGPRFFAPALPFLLLGLPFAFRARPRLTLAFVVASVALSTANSLTWFERDYDSGYYRGFTDVANTVWSPGDLSRVPGAVLIFLASGVAVAFAANVGLKSMATKARG